MPEQIDELVANAHICLEMEVPPRAVLNAAALAVRENEENAPLGDLQASPRVGVARSPTVEAFGAALTGKKWKPGRTLRVRHLDGAPQIHAKVEHYARMWEQFANIRLDFVASGPAEIRISYHLDNRSWSYVGTDALSIREPAETMHYGWLTPDKADEEFRRVIVHEFGHALGMIHEHVSPAAKIDWNKPVVYRHYAMQGWSKADVDNNLFNRQDPKDTQFTQYDDKSIMHYPVPAEFTNDGKSVGWNHDLSATDKQFIARIYPPAAAGGAPAMGTLSAQDQSLHARWDGTASAVAAAQEETEPVPA